MNRAVVASVVVKFALCNLRPASISRTGSDRLIRIAQRLGGIALVRGGVGLCTGECSIVHSVVGLHVGECSIVHGDSRASLLGAHIELIALNVAISALLTGVVREALERRRVRHADGYEVRVIGRSGQLVIRTILVLGVPNGPVIVIDKALGKSVAGALAELLLGVRLCRPTCLVDGLLNATILLGALDDELLAVALGQGQLGASALVMNLGGLERTARNAKRTGNSVVPDGDRIAILRVGHVTSGVRHPPPLRRMPAWAAMMRSRPRSWRPRNNV